MNDTLKDSIKRELTVKEAMDKVEEAENKIDEILDTLSSDLWPHVGLCGIRLNIVKDGSFSGYGVTQATKIDVRFR